VPGIDLTSTCILLCGWAAAMVVASILWARLARMSAERFMVAGRRVPGSIGTLALLAAWTWALSINAPAQAAYNFGVAGPIYFGVGGGLMLIMLAPFAGRIRELSPLGHTLPEFIGRRHGPGARATILVINTLSVGVLLLLNLSVVAYAFETFTPLSYAQSVWIVAAIVVAYTSISGIGASIVTNVIQIAVITLAAALVVPAVVASAGGPAAFLAAMPSIGEKANPLSLTAFLKMGLPFLVMSGVSPFSYPDLWQLAWTLREGEVRRAYTRAGLAYMPYGMVFGALGLMALATGVTPGQPDASDIAPVMARAYLSTGLQAAFLGLVLAAACSTCDTGLSALAALFMNDVYRPLVRPGAGDRETLLAGRLAMAMGASVVALLAMRKISLLDTVFFLGAAKGAMVFPLLSSLYWRRVSPAGFIAGIAGGMALGIGLYGILHDVTEYYRVISIPASILMGAGLCVAVSRRGRAEFDFESLTG